MPWHVHEVLCHKVKLTSHWIHESRNLSGFTQSTLFPAWVWLVTEVEKKRCSSPYSHPGTQVCSHLLLHYPLMLWDRSWKTLDQRYFLRIYSSYIKESWRKTKFQRGNHDFHFWSVYFYLTGRYPSEYFETSVRYILWRYRRSWIEIEINDCQHIEGKRNYWHKWNHLWRKYIMLLHFEFPKKETLRWELACRQFIREWC